jgi:putative aldouronate transport system permease protein
MLRQRSDSIFQWINGIFIFLFCLTMIAPMIHLLAVSLSDPVYAEARLIYLWPKGFQIDIYRTLFGMGMMWRAMGVSIYITVVGVLLCLLLTSSLAFTLARPQMPARKWFVLLILFTFIFPVPLIPSFFVVKSLGMNNSLWALIIPGALGAYYVFIMKTFFQGISKELIDAMKVDGRGELGVYLQLMLPLSMPVLATIALFHAVGQWNGYFNALIYIHSKDLYPLQLLLRNIVQSSGDNRGIGGALMDTGAMQSPQTLKASAILFSTLPILVIYPFLQKYFTKGAMLGSLKE